MCRGQGFGFDPSFRKRLEWPQITRVAELRNAWCEDSARWDSPVAILSPWAPAVRKRPSNKYDLSRCCIDSFMLGDWLAFGKRSAESLGRMTSISRKRTRISNPQIKLARYETLAIGSLEIAKMKSRNLNGIYHPPCREVRRSYALPSKPECRPARFVARQPEVIPSIHEAWLSNSALEHMIRKRSDSARG